MERCVIAVSLVAGILVGCSSVGCSSTGSMSKPSESVVIDLRHPFTECPVHHEKLIEATEPIEATHISWDADYLKARREQFPMAMRHLTHHSANQAQILYCPKCRAAEEAYQQKR